MDKTDQDNSLLDLLIRYYDGETTEEEMRKIEAWTEKSDENQKQALDICTLLLAADTKHIADNMDVERELSKVKMKMKVKRVKKDIAWWKWVQRFAAIMFIPMGLTIGVLLSQSDFTSTVNIPMLEIQAQPGVVTSFRLPDSTLVYLNSGSTIKYPSVFASDIREVSLAGEAYFDVTKDATRKFIVVTPQKIKVEVLGTRFNVEAFDDMDDVFTTLIEGKVELLYRQSGKEQKVVMKPGQKTIYNKKSEQIFVQNTNGISELSWKDMKIVLDQTPLRNALQMLSKRYNIEFIVKTSKYDKYTFTGTFTDQYVDEILENFKISSRICWRNVDATGNSYKKRQIEIY